MAKQNKATQEGRDSPMGLRALARNLKVGVQPLREALVNVAPVGELPGGHPAWTVTQAEAALQASGSRGSIGPLKDQKLQEQIRQLKLVNDLKASKLVARDHVQASFLRAHSRIMQARTESEAQDPLSLVGKDLAAMREGIAKVWDKVGIALAACAEDFRETTKPTKGEK